MKIEFESWEDTCKKAADVEREEKNELKRRLWSFNGRWGEWLYNPTNYTLRHEKQRYEVALERIESMDAIGDWVEHLKEKNYFGQQDIVDLLAAFLDIFRNWRKPRIPNALKGWKPSSDNPLVGKYFHTFYEENGRRIVESQGIILDAVDGKLVVQFFEWLAGSPSSVKKFDLDEADHWNLYNTNDAMCDYYENEVL